MEIRSKSKVRIKKGAVIKNTLRGFNDPYEAKRSYVVVVHDVSEGYRPTVGIVTIARDKIREGFFESEEMRLKFNEWLDENGLVTLEEALYELPERFIIEDPYIHWIMSDPEICWVGSGGYWHYTSINNVEVVE